MRRMGAKVTPELPIGIEQGEETPVNLIEVSGVIKWFDASKGYGFIVPDNGAPDILLHVTCLHRDGFQTAYEGARVVCEVLDRPKGLQAFRVLSMDEYLASRPISLPLRLFDFCLETDGAVAAVVTTTERARDLPQPPALIRAVAGGMPRDMRAGMMFPIISRDMLEFGAAAAGKELWKRAGVGPADIDVAQIYDCFTISLLVQIEAFGFCPVGEAGDFIDSGALGRGGSLPINTAGGNMSEGYIHGMNHVIEAVRQVRGQASNQVVGAELAFVSSGPLPVGGGTVIRSDA